MVCQKYLQRGIDAYWDFQPAFYTNGKINMTLCVKILILFCIKVSVHLGCCVFPPAQKIPYLWKQNVNGIVNLLAASLQGIQKKHH